MSSHARHRAAEGDGRSEGDGTEDGAGQAGAAESDAPLDDAEQTAKDRSYTPGSERETVVRQAESAGDAALRPGTGGPDDSGDLPGPGDPDPDDLDAATVVQRSGSGHRPGDG
jgi:hypothetical protein